MTSLVAIHGNGGGGFRFARVEPFIDDDVRFEAVTLPGFGGRPGDPALETLRDYAEQLWREIEHLPRPLVVLGHGIGDFGCLTGTDEIARPGDVDDRGDLAFHLRTGGMCQRAKLFDFIGVALPGDADVHQ